MNEINLNSKNLDLDIAKLRSGQNVFLSGSLLTLRDSTCARLIKSKKSPVSLKNKMIFFCGPTPTPNGRPIGSCGPTTTSRMQGYFENLFKMGVVGFIGKGQIGDEYLKLFSKNGGALFSVTGGIGALLSTKVKRSKIVAYEDLGPEAIWEIEVEDFPAIVVADSLGNHI